MTTDAHLESLLDRWLELHAQGDSITPAQLCGDRPELVPQLQQRIGDLLHMQRFLKGSGASGNTTTFGPADCPPPAGSPTPGLPPADTAPPGYVIEGELGRGGMGVVYRALQVQLNRTVALKMIRDSGLAGVEERVRFLAEAEAVAAIKHPGIVQIYYIGKHNGLPFFALEFCPGGSLVAKLAGKPVPGLEAAHLIEQVARAVHAAHSAGIVHRDLKPGNILLAADGSPRVTDFGLAKRLEAGEGMTQTGAVMGTPPYMAPEQARGLGKHIGPAADVYAVGAILYECLTGRPPFLAATSAETLLQVLEQEPVSVRQLQPAVPADLETICLKCLHKEPARRYASALELAEDLRRFQAGEPIVARPVSRVERAVKWMRRNPVLARAVALLVVLSLLAGTLITWQWRRAVAALDRAEQEQRQRALSQVMALRDAAPGAVPTILADLQDSRAEVLPHLRELYAETSDRGKRMRLALALLPTQPDLVRDELAAWMLQVPEPAEVLVIRDALQPHAAALVKQLWQKAGDRKTPPAERFRALVGLATFDTDNPHWKKKDPGLLDELLTANPLHVGTWIRALRPVRKVLIGPLEEVFRGQRLVEHKQVAALVLADYAFDQPDLLADLLLDADPKQYALLWPVMQKYRAQAVRRMRQELARMPDYWKDAPLPPAWKEPAVELKRTVEQAGGVVAERFALCQALPLVRLKAVTEELRGSGYRPVRVRPYAVGAEVRVAVVWTRDGRDWQLEVEQSADALAKRDGHWQKEGYIPADVAQCRLSLRERTPCYAGVWVRAGKGEQGVLHVGLSEREHSARKDELKKKGLVPWTVQGLAAPDGTLRYSGVWRQGPGQPEKGEVTAAAAIVHSATWAWASPRATVADCALALWVAKSPITTTAANTEPEHAGKVFDEDALLVDVDVCQAGPLRRYASVWHDDATRCAVGLHGLKLEAHLTRCQELAGQGYRPVALAVTSVSGERDRVAASVWHRPVLTLPQTERAARRQASAAATLLHLGQTKEVWPLFLPRRDPTLRSYLVQRTGLVGVDAPLLVERLKGEQNASARAALIVALGEYSEKELPAKLRQSLVKKLLEWYRHDPDPGVHGAIDWLLRHAKEGPNDRPLHWGQAKQLEQIDQELRRRDPDAKRRWYVNGQGQTMVLVPGPGEFRMGSPHTYTERYMPLERPHRRRIGRSFALASKPVTVAQWQQFLKERPKVPRDYNQRYGPDTNGPIINVSWYMAAQYCNWLSEKEGIPKEQWCYPENPDEIKAGMKPYPDYLKRRGYRLPTEAEWEYACRAGTLSSRYFGSSEELLPRYAHYLSNSQDRTWPVGQKRPNDLGLFDMYGNVWNWCQEVRLDDYPQTTAGQPAEDQEDTRIISDVQSRITRGASFIYHAPYVRSATRDSEGPANRPYSVGMRLCRTCD
jgi:formylglycine-generating enzyme required for sulfatase activity